MTGRAAQGFSQDEQERALEQYRDSNLAPEHLDCPRCGTPGGLRCEHRMVSQAVDGKVDPDREPNELQPVSEILALHCEHCGTAGWAILQDATSPFI